VLRVRRSHRSDALVAGLAEDLLTVQGDPLLQETVVVQSRGMERWLSHRLAETLGSTGTRDGISANIRFAFPGSVIQEVLRAAVSDVSDLDPWDPDRLSWTILALLPELLEESESERLSWYLGDTGNVVDRRRFTLSRELADLYDRYAMYRPRMVGSWSDGDLVGPDGSELGARDRWQAKLWRRVVQTLETPSPDRRYAEAIEVLGDPSRRVPDLPCRVAFFGTSALPPVHIRLLAALSRHIPVTLHLTSPSSDLWRRIHEAVAETDATSVTDVISAVARTQANPLLVSCGRLARDSQATLEVGARDYEDMPIETADAGADAPDLLRLVRSDILADRDRGAPTTDIRSASPVTLTETDRSIEVHACHGPARQVEVLHDALLGAFDDLEGLEPRDVLVMAPDIEAYAPHIGAVFGGGRIRYELADRSLHSTNPVAEAILAVAELPDSRVGASRVLDLIALAPVRRRFALGEADLARIREWIAATGIRWGIDDAHRDEHGQPRDRYHTWRFGLDRLLVGVAMADEDDRIVGDVAPFDDMEGDAVDLLERFVAFWEALSWVCASLTDPRTIREWADALDGAIAMMTEVPAGDEWLTQQVRSSIDDLVTASHGAGSEPSDLEIDLASLREMLGRGLDTVPRRAGYETGAVTFSSMVPMRSIPHRVVCLLGMDDGAFPRITRPLGFDLIARSPQVGDRTGRDEDRYLFLEAILAAEERLIVTYTGRDTKTNEERPPAVPVGELLDVIDRSTEEVDGLSGRERVVIHHPLQAFSPRNFGVDERGERTQPLSYDTVQLGAARAHREPLDAPPVFFPDALPEDPDFDDRVIELDELTSFYNDPVKWLLRNRIGLSFFEKHVRVEDVEPLDLDNLGKWRLGDALLRVRMRQPDAASISDEDLETWRRTVLARGDVPVGAPGRFELDAVLNPVGNIIEMVDAFLATEPDDVVVDVVVGGRRLVGLLRDVRDGKLVRWQFSRLKEKQRLEAWIRHLALNLAQDLGQGDVEPVSCYIGRAGKGEAAAVIGFPALGDDPDHRHERASAHLVDLVDLYLAGRVSPLPLFPESSCAYAEAIHAGKPEDTALEAAKKAWLPGYQPWVGDSQQAHIEQAYGGLDFEEIVAETRFTEVARTVWIPVLEAEGAP
jgi:exodeoxyribonuclease V gamma subunit